MDPVVLVPAGVLLIVAGILLVAASTALQNERRPDDPTYRPQHLARRPSLDEIQRALNDTRRELRRSPAPWAHQGKRHSDKTP